MRVEHRPLYVPRGDRSALMEPPWGQVRDLVAENIRLREQCDYDFHGRRMAEISHLARAELLEAARRWTAAYRDIPAESPNPGGLIYLAGHQPRMPHPGVWFKNFALGQAAKRHGAVGVNVIVDNDVAADPSIPVPGGTVLDPRVEPIPFDRPDPDSNSKIPYEERRIKDRDVFSGFGRRVVERIAPLVAEPLMRAYWPLVCARARQTDNLGACLAQARHQLEGAWGLDTLEVPLGRLCGGEAFSWFVADLLARLPEFRAIHNEAVRAYRRQYRIRSAAHPVPELAEDGDWLEAPFWVWTVADPRRRRLFCHRSTAGEMVLSDRSGWLARLPLRDEGELGRTVERLLELRDRGARIRPRALTTTLWARLVLGDLFLHGVGGAKYDEVTDRLVDRFFGRRPPGFAVVSATLLLPIERDRATEDDARAIQGELRGLNYHPERHFDQFCGTAALGRARSSTQPWAAVPHLKTVLDLIETKRRWIETPQTAENAKRRCRAIRHVNAALQPWLVERRRQILDRQARTLQKLRAEKALAWREYAFGLYPEATLRGFFLGLFPKMA